MRKIILTLIIISISTFINSCSKEKCQTCTKTIGGVAGNITVEVRKVCDEQEAQELEDSSSGTTHWECE